jgi:copper(I)-binding protein
MTKNLPTILLLIGIYWLTGCDLAAQPEIRNEIKISGAWMRNPLAGRTMSTAYMSIENLGNQTDTLLAITSPNAARIEFHDTERHDNVMRMVQRSEIEIKVGATAHFKPGGAHLMIFGLDLRPEQEEVAFKFVFAKAGEMPYALPLLTSAP